MTSLSIAKVSTPNGIVARFITPPLLSKADLQSNLAAQKAKFNRFEKWEFTHYKKAGFLGWIARFILRLMPSLQSRFNKIAEMKISIKLMSFGIYTPGLTPKAQVEMLCFLNQLKKPETILKLPALSDELRNSKECMLAAVAVNGLAFGFVSSRLREDKELTLAAVKQNSAMVQLTSSELQVDREVVLAAVKQNGCSLKYMDPKFGADKEVVLAAIENDEWASLFFKNLDKAGRYEVDQKCFVLKYIDSNLLVDKDVVLATVKKYSWAKKIVLAAVKQDSSLLQYASLELQKDPDILAACQS